jgi:hypothetical protein
MARVGISVGLDLPYRLPDQKIPAKKKEVNRGNNSVVQAV